MITENEFGITAGGETVREYTLKNGNGNSVGILNYGCTVRSIRMFGTDVCLGYDSLKEYETRDGWLGAAVGRCANRIKGGLFSLNGKEYQLARNDGPNHLHGGPAGFSHRVWDAEIAGDALVFHYFSPDGEEHYPGNLHVSVTYRLSEDNSLSIAYHAVADSDTILNLTNHTYFNLNGGGSILGHLLQISADEITPCDENCLTTGAFLPVVGTPFDFRVKKPVGRDINVPHPQLRNGGGYDHNYVLKSGDPAAVLTGDLTGITMCVFTDQPGLQLYTGNSLADRSGKNGSRYGYRTAVCLETQNFPSAVTYPQFPSPVLKAGEHYDSVTVYRFRKDTAE